MKRRILNLGLLLFAGAIINVAVAWTCALLVSPFEMKQPTIGLEISRTDAWELTRGDGIGSTWMLSTRSHVNVVRFKPMSQSPAPASIVPGWSDVCEPTDEYVKLLPSIDIDIGQEKRTIVANGIPMRSVWCEIYRGIGIAGQQRSWIESRLLGGFDSKLPAWQSLDWPRVIPLRPLWPGFAINTLFYAAIVWLLLFAPFKLRRWRRIRRDLCPACAYDLSGGSNQVCPECGKPVVLQRGKQSAICD